MSSKRFWYFMTGAVALFVAATVTGTAGAASTARVLYNFTGGNDGGNAATQLVFDGQGNAYGTTVAGGLFGCGTIFRLTPTAHGQWTPKTLHDFSCGSDGKNPHGGVTFDSAGNLYGTTVAGGNGGFCTGDGCGVVFKLSPHQFRVLYNFTGGNDGFGPGSPVTFDKAGNIYGTAPDGGVHKMGVVYQLSFHQNRWQQTVIHAFTGHGDGGVGSLGALLIDAQSNIFGIAEIGGIHQAGTAYKISPGAGGTWTFAKLWDFKGSPDAGYPYGGLIADSNGDLFGTTYYGGANGLGSVYELIPKTGKYTERLLYSFQGGNDGSSSTSTLNFDSAGDLLGTTSAGGNTCDCGTIFKIAAGTGAESILYRFGSSTKDGAYPYYGLTLDPSGSFDTSTVAGGLYGQGTIFQLTP